MKDHTPELDRDLTGWVRAERINDIMAKPNTRKHQDYLKIVSWQMLDPNAIDPQDQYRGKDLLDRALEAYEMRHRCTLERYKVYELEQFQICCAPEGIYRHLRLGVTAHIRISERTFNESVERDVTPEMERLAQAMMHVTGMQFWSILDYLEDPVRRIRKLHEHVIDRNEKHGLTLEEAMINFLTKTRLRAAS